MAAPMTPAEEPNVKHGSGSAPLRHPEQLRAAIDSGRTGDKVQISDPAAAPLGTDEEAAGTPVSPEAVALAAAHENRASAHAPRTRGPGYAWILIGFIFVAAAVLMLPLLWRS